MRSVIIGALALVGMLSTAQAMNHGFDPDAPATQWFEGLKQPPAGVVSCCGKSDAYPVDQYEKQADGSYIVWVADGDAIVYPDGTRRTAWDVNIPVIVPADKVNDLQDDLDNPTDHGWLFFVPIRSYPQNGDEPPPSKSYSVIYCFIRHPQGG